MRSLKHLTLASALLLVAGCTDTSTEPMAVESAAIETAPAMAMADNAGRQPLVVEFPAASDFTDATMLGDELGWSQLKRDADGLQAVVHADGLKPGGVFTFWWIAVQDDATFPDDIFVAYGAGAVIGENGKATVHMSADKGDASIVGLPALGDALFGDLVDTENSLVRVEVAYHGQVENAGDALPVWLSDFWTGDPEVCPIEGENPAGQPHCPVYFASTHVPPGLGGGAAFAVNVTVTASLIPQLPVGTEFPNCYTFQANGVWIDPGFPDPASPVPGMWTQDVSGVTARYTATAEADGLLLEQRGTVTPFRGGIRKLKAHSELIVGGTVLAEFLSRGQEVETCSP